MSKLKSIVYTLHSPAELLSNGRLRSSSGRKSVAVVSRAQSVARVEEMGLEERGPLARSTKTSVRMSDRRSRHIW